MGYRIKDFGCDGATGIDFPEIAYPLALAVASQQCDLGILIGSIGMGMTMVANKVRGIRAATVQDEFTAHCARESYHCNIISIGVDLVGGKEIHKIAEVFLLTTVSVGRHARRIEKLKQLEELLANAPLRTAVRRSRHPIESHL